MLYSFVRFTGEEEIPLQFALRSHSSSPWSAGLGEGADIRLGRWQKYIHWPPASKKTNKQNKNKVNFSISFATV